MLGRRFNNVGVRVDGKRNYGKQIESTSMNSYTPLNIPTNVQLKCKCIVTTHIVLQNYPVETCEM